MLCMQTTSPVRTLNIFIRQKFLRSVANRDLGIATEENGYIDCGYTTLPPPFSVIHSQPRFLPSRLAMHVTSAKKLQLGIVRRFLFFSPLCPFVELSSRTLLRPRQVLTMLQQCMGGRVTSQNAWQWAAAVRWRHSERGERLPSQDEGSRRCTTVHLCLPFTSLWSSWLTLCICSGHGCCHGPKEDNVGQQQLGLRP